jgi:hypothetical protein
MHADIFKLLTYSSSRAWYLFLFRYSQNLRSNEPYIAKLISTLLSPASWTVLQLLLIMDRPRFLGESNIAVQFIQLNVLVQRMDEPIADAAEQCPYENH